MQRYAVSQFDGGTFQVIDVYERREICVCTDCDGWDDAEDRAQKIAFLLNEKKANELGAITITISNSE
jgi:hypothetical protein